MKDEVKAVDLRTRTKQFALRIIRLFGSLPKSTEAQVLGKQLLRSGTSVGANYREAHVAGAKPSSSRNAEIHSGNWRNQGIGWSCSSMAKSWLRPSCNLSAPSATN